MEICFRNIPISENRSFYCVMAQEGSRDGVFTLWNLPLMVAEFFQYI
jgi:hypothetical protein